jgi:CRISPR-associated protein Csm2
MTEIKTIIQEDQPERLVKFAEKEGRGLAKLQLTPSQIRNVFGQVRQIEAMWRIPTQQAQAERLLLLLKPRMAYQAAKENNRGVQQLRDILTEAIEAVYENTAPRDDERERRFRRFTELFEALLAYHKAESGEGRGGRS